VKTKIGIGLALAILGSLVVAGLAGAQGPYPYPPNYNFYAFPPGFYNGYNQGVQAGFAQRYDDGSAAPLFTNVQPYFHGAQQGDFDHQPYFGANQGIFNPQQPYFGGPYGGFHSGPYYCFRNPYVSDGYFTYYFAGGNYYFAGFNLPACHNTPSEVNGTAP
jgi:hypothetical protein